jgi:hypothetical protein
MKRAKTPQQLAKNASKLHKHVGNLLVELFPTYEVRQEYPVNKINPSFESSREKFDWVVLGLNIVVEVHGIQHYEPTCFGGITGDQAKRNLRKRQEVDWDKQEAAEKAGWAYLVVKYDETKMTAEELSSRIVMAIADSQQAEEIEPAKPKAKIQSRGFQKKTEEYKWPTRKIPSRKFNQ